jgi:hypothetical protein
MLEEAIYLKLVNDTNITGAVDKRIYPNKLPNSPTLPAIRYNKISENKIRGFSSIQVSQSRMQFTCCGSSFSDSKNVAKKIFDCLDNFSGLISDFEIKCIYLINEFDYYSDESAMYLTVADYYIWS